jgi:hypothetical protein
MAYWLPSPVAYSILLAFPLYLLLVQAFRYHRAKYHERLCRATLKDDATEISILDAQKIYRSLFYYEFPFVCIKGIQLALLRTYAIPTISSLLNRTALLASPRTIPLRYAETWALFNEFALRDYGSESWIQAVGRTRSIHLAYRKSGKIREEDMLYTLSVVATQPLELINNLEWRKVTDAEICAVGTLYRGIADALEIDYQSLFDALPELRSDDRSKTYLSAATDRFLISGLTFYSNLRTWQQCYENRAMKFTAANQNLASTAIKLLLWGVPGKALKHLATAILSVLMDDALRSAVGYSPPSFLLRVCVSSFLKIRKIMLRYLSLPRPSVMSKKATYDTMTDAGTITMKSYLAAPYFVAPTFWNRWSLGAWWWWLLGLPLPSKSKQDFQPNGYMIRELGPRLGKSPSVQVYEEEAVRKVLARHIALSS